MDICGKLFDASPTGGGRGLAACSSCAGDYEDPDRTAASEGDETETGPGEGRGEFRGSRKDSRS